MIEKKNNNKKYLLLLCWLLLSYYDLLLLPLLSNLFFESFFVQFFCHHPLIALFLPIDRSVSVSFWMFTCFSPPFPSLSFSLPFEEKELFLFHPCLRYKFPLLFSPQILLPTQVAFGIVRGSTPTLIGHSLHFLAVLEFYDFTWMSLSSREFQVFS